MTMSLKIGETLRNMRRKRDKTQTFVCNKLKISQTYLSQIENGKKEPSAPMLRKICKMYHIPVACLLWFSLTEADVRKDRIKEYREVKPTIDSLINRFI